MELIIFFIAIIFAWVIITFNLLIRDKNRVLTAWSDIDVQLKRRHELIPKLVEVVRQYASYESATITAVTELRRQTEDTAVTERADLEKQLGDNLHTLVALAEGYPDLKASTSFLDLQHNLSNVEKDIQYARRYYNGSVRDLNIRIESFPNLFIAGFLGFRKAEYFQMED